MSSFLLQNTNLDAGDNTLLMLDGNDREIRYRNVRVFQRDIPAWLLGL
ncbi:hypothetical protein [Desulfosarcina sp. BuS5]|nr:hypothetical protein [Desulfosarcina sp. BuS5]